MADQIRGLFSPWLRKKRIKMALPYIQGRILDYGCGIGVLAELCKPDLYLGVDIDNESINIARKNHSHFKFLQELPEDEKFNTIIGLAVIEHIDDPVSLLKRFESLLELKGHIVLTTPHPSFRWAHEMGSKIGFFSPDSHEHKSFIGYENMKEMVQKTDLVIKSYKQFLFGANQLFVLQKVSD